VNRRLRVAIAIIWSVFAAFVAWRPYRFEFFGGPDGTVADSISIVVVHGTYLTVGLLLWSRRPENRIGRLLVAFAFWGLVGSLTPRALYEWPEWIGGSLIPLGAIAAVIIAWLVLAFPTGRLTKPARVVVIFAFVVTILFNSVYTVAVIAHRPELVPATDRIHTPLIAVIALAVLTIVVTRFVRATPPARRALIPMWIAAAVVALLFASGPIQQALALSEQGSIMLASMLGYAIGAIPIAYGIGLLRLSRRRTGVGKLVLELNEQPAPGKLRESLARTLGDPSVELAFTLPDGSGYIGLEGKPIELPGEGSGRAVTLLERGPERFGALIYDATLAEAPELVASVGAATALALENERLQAAVRAQLQEVTASRQRIVEAADAERRRVERNLHDGAQQRLMTLALALRRAKRQVGEDTDVVDSLLAEASAELDTAVEELRELARGIHPAILTNEGLGPALESLVDRSGVPVQLRVSAAERLPATVEVAAYFVVSEALANAVKHARANTAAVTVERRQEKLLVEVSDDGMGGADPEGGSGLKGLADRVTALGGRLSVDSPHGRGTRVIATLPCA
jgi:signal transduction histidine kinase